jgi:dTDP-4-amino-4,6-dideoxygalactose transaminase
MEKNIIRAKEFNDSEDFPDMPADHYFNQNTTSWTISRISRGILNSTDPDLVVEKRRSNYTRLYQSLVEMKNIKIITGALPPAICPLIMPVLVPDVMKWQSSLVQHGVAAIRWWVGFHKKIDYSGFPDAIRLKKELLALPVHQFLNSNDIDFMIKCLQVVTRS